MWMRWLRLRPSTLIVTRTHSTNQASGGIRRTWKEFHASTLRFGHDELLQSYQELVDRGALEWNDSQQRVLQKLGRISSLVERHQKDDGNHVREDRHSTSEDASQATDTATSTASGENRQSPMVPRGLYIHGRVGVGKSMLMDLFYRATDVQRKRRSHFHEFMLEAHQRIFALKQRDIQEKGRNTHVDTTLEKNPVFRVGEDLANEVSLLCFDEFQVTDIADAMIMSTLFRALWSKGVVVVATSNRHPSELYENGLNREYFLPFIELLERQCKVYALEGQEDYRLRTPTSEKALFYPVSLGATDDLYQGLLNEVHHVNQSMDSSIKRWGHRKTIDVRMGRFLSVRTPSEGVACVSFSELCEEPLGAADYEALADKFNTIYLRDVPLLTAKQFDAAKRFLTLIDVLYEYQSSLRMSAEGPPQEILREIANTGDASSQTDAHGVSQVATSAAMTEISFAAERAISRLTEMTGERCK